MIDLYGIHPDTLPFTESEAQEILDATAITDDDTCTWIPDDCHEPATRLAIFTVDHTDYTVKFLCERHKQMGQWDGYWKGRSD